MHGRLTALPLLIILATLCASPLHADVTTLQDAPTPHKSMPRTKLENERIASLHEFALGLLCERNDSIFEALEAFRKSAQLDPEAAAAYKEQIPLLLALDRFEEALAASQNALALDPDDYEVWYIYARQLKKADKVQQTRSALERGLAVPAIKSDPRFALQMLLDLGLLYEGQDAWLEAASAYDRAAHILDDSEATLDFGPFSEKITARRSAEIHERVGRMFAQAEKYTEALASYQRAQQRYPDDAGRLNFNLAQIAHKQGKIGQSLAYLDAYLRLQPQSTEAYEQKIDLLTRLERKAEIVPWLEQSIQTDPYNVNVKLLLAKQYGKFGKGDAAEKLLLTLSDASPLPEVYQTLFELYRTDANYDMARALPLIDATFRHAHLQKIAVEPSIHARQAKSMIAALRTDDTATDRLVQVADARVAKGDKLNEQTLHLLGVLALRRQKHVEAEHFYRMCLKQEKCDNETLCYAGLLQALWKGNKFEDIEKVCRDGLRTADAKSHILLYNDLAKVLARLERYDEAIKSVDQATKLAEEPDQLTLRFLRARILVHARQFTQAENECLTMLKENQLPGEVLEIRYLLSVIYSTAKQLAKAEEQLEQVLQLDPNNATANNDLGYIWADQNKHLDKAEQLIRKALELDRRRQETGEQTDAKHERAAYIDSLGWVLYRQGKMEAAVRELEKAVKLPDGDDPTIYEHLGDVYHHLGRNAEASSAWQRSLELYDQQKSRRMDERYQQVEQKIRMIRSK